MHYRGGGGITIGAAEVAVASGLWCQRGKRGLFGQVSYQYYKQHKGHRNYKLCLFYRGRFHGGRLCSSFFLRGGVTSSLTSIKCKQEKGGASLRTRL
ncbi:hypothetical protein GDO78_022394 [Eleutherodactylus coqui]|uniref:Uncharacterized protein n=1 Tax=Eleutherodactylus coqui TaxID=57060 RepID=A0A8J6EQX2_ELECQ|nr:hypothetical protein GDO78_022394 [Eleutherodactylus coqui]